MSRVGTRRSDELVHHRVPGRRLQAVPQRVHLGDPGPVGGDLVP